MKKFIFYSSFIALGVSSLIASDEYGFSMNELNQMELKSYDFSGYIKAQHKHQNFNKDSMMYASKNKDSQETYLGELFINYKYFQDQFTFNTDLVVNYENIDSVSEDTYTINQAVVTYKIDNFHELNLGKRTPKWGKGYFSNPIAFIDRKKDPNEPEANKEGFTGINYKFNKVYQGDLQNIGLEINYLRTTEDFNEELYAENSNIFASKLYLLYKDIDIDIAYVYNDKDTNKFGIDFSTNLQTNFEIHGEYAKYDTGEFSYLLGLKYLTDSELTLISEYLYKSEEQIQNQPLWDNRYFINKITQKDPFNILYWSVYFMDTFNLDDRSHQDSLGVIYTGFKNLELDFSIAKMSGDTTSEYGAKLIENYTWLQVKYSF